MTTGKRMTQWLGLAMGTALLVGCGERQPDPQPQPTPSDEPRSIFVDGSDADAAAPAEAIGPLETTIGFPDDAELSEQARAELATVLESPQVEQGGAIILRGHSDAGGSDEVNLRASQIRAEAVRDFLVENGIEEDRIEIIAFGEQNPVAPNALPDGTPNEEGRRRNRRVEILIEGESEQDADEAGIGEPTIVESIAGELETQRRGQGDPAR